MQRAWIVLIAACWKAGGAPPSTTTGSPPRAALDGRLQVAAAPYCGGAAMPPDYQPPPLRPAAGVTLRLVQGDKHSDAGPVIELTTAPEVETPLMVDIREPCAWAVCYHGSPPP